MKDNIELSDDKILELYQKECNLNMYVSRTAHIYDDFGEWFRKNLSIENTVNVSNNSGKTACVCISTKKIPKIKKIEIGRLGALEFGDEIENVIQKYTIIPNTGKLFELDNPIMFYTIVFIICGEPFVFCENIQMDTRKYDLNINYKHSATAIMSKRFNKLIEDIK